MQSHVAVASRVAVPDGIARVVTARGYHTLAQLPAPDPELTQSWLKADDS